MCDYRNADFDGLRGALEALNLCNLITRQRRNQLGLDLLEGRIYERKKIKGKKHPALDHQ